MKSLAHPEWPYAGTAHEWRGFVKDERGEFPASMVVYLPPSMYDHAEKAGVDMRYYRKTQPIPAVYQKQNFGPGLK